MFIVEEDYRFSNNWVGVQIALLPKRLLKSSISGPMVRSGMDRVSFHKPIFEGDTLTPKFAIESMRETAKADRRVIIRPVELFNQHNESLPEFSITGLVLRRSSDLVGD